jgi:flagellar biosynthesis protein FliR
MDSFDQILQSFWRLFNDNGVGIDLWLLLFARTVAFTTQAPIFGRKDVPTLPKLGFAMFLTTALMMGTGRHAASYGLLSGMDVGHYFILILVNVVIGAAIGFLARMMIEVVSSAGALMNSQIGLSSANMMDPSTKQQNALMGPIFSYIALLIYIEIGGVELLLKALMRSIEHFPLTMANPRFFQVIHPEIWIKLSEDSLEGALLIVAPFFVVTMVVDVMLGVVNRTAQQIPVFQLSSSTKPVVGLLVFLIVLPSMTSSIKAFLMTYAKLF